MCETEEVEAVSETEEVEIVCETEEVDVVYEAEEVEVVCKSEEVVLKLAGSLLIKHLPITGPFLRKKCLSFIFYMFLKHLRLNILVGNSSARN